MMSASTNNNHEGWIARSFHSDNSKQQQEQESSSKNSMAPENKQDNNNKTPITTTSTRLILHLDINETILLGDDAGGDSTSDSIQKLLAKSAFCQIIPSTTGDKLLDWDSTQQLEPTHWWDGQEIGHETSMPPLYTGWEWPPNSCPYCRTKFQKYSKEFVVSRSSSSTTTTTTAKEPQQPHHGKIYKPIWDECQKLLSTADETTTGTTTAAVQASRKRHPSLLPAFYHILDYLQELKDTTTSSSTSPTMVFRTFGTDIVKVAQWVTEYAQDQNCPWLELGPDKLFQGRWKELENTNDSEASTPGAAIYQLWDLDERSLVAENEEEILKLLNSGTIFGIVDDYDYWRKYNWLPTAGKPVWIPSSSSSSSYSINNDDDDKGNDSVFCHHLLFDDNIHNLPDDGIACIREQQQEETTTSAPNDEESSKKFSTVDAAIMHGEEYQGIHLKRVPTIEPVLNPKWYIEQIEHSRALLQEKMTKASQ